MRLLHIDGQSQLQARALVPVSRSAVPSSLTQALESRYTVRTERDDHPIYSDRSLLQLVLGLTGDPARVLELVVWAAGIDWATEILGKPRRRTDSTLTGADAVGIASSALEEIRPAVDALAGAATVLLSAEDSGSAWEQDALVALRRLTPLLSSVRVVPWYDVKHDRLVDVHESQDLVGLAAAELCEWGRDGHVVRVCGLCQRPFLPAERSDEVYCRRTAPDRPPWHRTCRDVGPQHRYAADLDDLTAVYRRAYKRLDVRQRRGRFQRGDLDAWRAGAKRLLDQAHQARWSVEELERALDDIAPEEST